MACYTVLYAGVFRFRSHMTSSYTKSHNSHFAFTDLPTQFSFHLFHRGLPGQPVSLLRYVAREGYKGQSSGFDLMLVFCSCCVLVCVLLSSVIRHHYAPLAHTAIVICNQASFGIACLHVRTLLGFAEQIQYSDFRDELFSDNYVDGLYRNL